MSIKPDKLMVGLAAALLVAGACVFFFQEDGRPPESSDASSIAVMGSAEGVPSRRGMVSPKTSARSRGAALPDSESRKLLEDYRETSSLLTGSELYDYQLRFMSDYGSKFKGVQVLRFLETVAESSSRMLFIECSSRFASNLFAHGDSSAIAGLAELDSSGVSKRIARDIGMHLGGRGVDGVLEFHRALDDVDSDLSREVMVYGLESAIRTVGITNENVDRVIELAESDQLNGGDLERIFAHADKSMDYTHTLDRLVDNATVEVDLAEIVGGWARLAPENAAFAYERRSESLGANLATSIARSWHSMDPNGASEWALNLDDEASRDAALFGIVQRSGLMSPSKAMTWAESISGKLIRRKAFESIIQSAKEQGVDKVEREARFLANQIEVDNS